MKLVFQQYGDLLITVIIGGFIVSLLAFFIQYSADGYGKYWKCPECGHINHGGDICENEECKYQYPLLTNDLKEYLKPEHTAN